MATKTSLRGSLGTTLAILAMLGCENVEETYDDPISNTEQQGIPRSSSWGEFRMSRHPRTSLEVVTRARSIAAVVLQNDQLPSANLMPQSVLDEWQARAQAAPFREGAFRFELEGRDILARYRPATDRLTISAMDTRIRPPQPVGYPDPGIGEVPALGAALDCMAQLEQRGVLGPGEFSRTPTLTSNHPVYFEDEAWVERYDFMFNPNLDGLPLRSAEVVISVNAWSGVCQRITVGGQVEVSRIGDAEVNLRDSGQASIVMEQRLEATSPPGVTEVRVVGDFGYFLPVAQTSAVVSPLFLGSYVSVSGSGEESALSRKFYAGLSLDDPDHEPLVDLLHPL